MSTDRHVMGTDRRIRGADRRFTGTAPSIPPRDSAGDERKPSVVSTAATLVVSYALLSAVLVGMGLALTHLLGPVVRWDDHVNSWFASHRTSGWNAVSKDGTFIANTLGIVVVGVVVTAVALLMRWGRIAALLVCALAVEIVTFVTVNYAVARPRPSAPHLGSTPSTYSFPSGHVAATFVLYGGIAVIVTARTRVGWARVLAWIVAIVATAWVALSRVYEAEHHPTDAVAGLLVGVGALIAAVLAIRPVWPAATGKGSTTADRQSGRLDSDDRDRLEPSAADGRRAARREMAR
jgi:undecaprenyl-diphosphatase